MTELDFVAIAEKRPCNFVVNHSQSMSDERKDVSLGNSLHIRCMILFMFSIYVDNMH